MMLKHIVIWRLKDSAHGNDKATNALLIKEKLKELRRLIPGLLKLEVGIPAAGAGTDQGDLVLYSVFESRMALEIYQTHPRHRAAAAFIQEAILERRVVDYEFSEPKARH